MGWRWFRGSRADLSYGMWWCLAQLQILILEASSREAGAAAKLAASNKVAKNAGLSLQGDFVPIAYLYFIPVWDDYMQIAAAKPGASWARLP